MPVIPPTFSGPGMLSPFVAAPASGSFGPPPGPDPYGSPMTGPDPYGSPMTGPDPYGSPMTGPDPTIGFGHMPAISMPPSMSSMAPPTSSGPPGYSFITGTVDPTAAEIVAAAGAAGMPIPPGMDPIMFSRMMSGDPAALAAGPPPIPAAPPPPMTPPLAVSTPPPTTAAVAPAAIPPPTAAPVARAPLIPIKKAIEPVLTTKAPAPTVTTPKLFIEKLKSNQLSGVGGYSRCDPITGKCSNYA